MVAVKKKTKKVSPARLKKRRRWLTFFAFVVIFVILSGLMVFLVFGPEEPTVLPKFGENGHVPVISYEETGGLSDSITSDSPEGNRQVTPALESLVKEVERPRIAIVIDDMGHNKKICEALINLDLNLSFAFLPFGPYTVQQAARANRLGRDVLLHFPMEATDPKWKPGPGTVTIAMDYPVIQTIFDENMASVPYAVGINNHMGSRFTQNGDAMRDFMTILKETGLFFLDSRTSRNSVGYSLAREMGVRSARRDIFLDNVRDPQKIIIQLRKLLGVARRQGFAVAIGHPYPETLQALKEFKRELLRRSELVGIEVLVH